MSKAQSIVWNGKNLAAVKAFHKDVKHYPRKAGDDSYRDASQHPDNLHLEVDGRMLIAAPGDTITKDAKGGLSVVEGSGRRPAATGRHGAGRTFDVEGGGR